jgi:myo-inositol-1(or 4)-monophosphatase
MTMNKNDERLSFTRQLARRAGELALDYFNDFTSLTISSKGVQDMASEADVNTEALIEKAITERYPDDNFLGEESVDSFCPQAGKGTWIVDPIDGTQPFVNGIRSWCISIAYVEGTEMKIGVIFDPVADEMFVAQKGRGASLNGKPIQCNSAQNLGEGLVSVGYSNRVKPEDTLLPLTRLLHAQGMYHRSGSGALSLAYVATGRLIGYFEPHMNSWDFAAGALMICEAGGRINDCLPNQAAIIKGEVVIAACDGVYDQLEEVING